MKIAVNYEWDSARAKFRLMAFCSLMLKLSGVWIGIAIATMIGHYVTLSFPLEWAFPSANSALFVYWTMKQPENWNGLDEKEQQ